MQTLKKIFGNPFFIFVLCAALLISIIPVVLTAMGQGSYVKSAVQTVTAPFQWCFSKIGEGIGGFPIYFRTLSSLRRENTELKQQISDMEDAVYDARLLKDENDFLRAYLATRAEHIDFELTDATVVGYSSTNYETVCTLSKGSLAGIEKNMPVITEEGLLGYICEVGQTWSRVRILTETNAAVGVYIERSGVTGIVEGNLSLRMEGLCRMVYIDGAADIRIDDMVVTSGVGSAYPRGLKVGRVKEISEDSASRTLMAVIEPVSPVTAVRKVMIVTNFDRIEEDNEQPAS